MMHPTDHTSIDCVYAFELSMISGARYHRVATYSESGEMKKTNESGLLRFFYPQKTQAYGVPVRNQETKRKRTSENTDVVVFRVGYSSEAKVTDLEIAVAVE